MPYNIRLPDGTIIQNVPDDMPRSEVRERILLKHPELRTEDDPAPPDAQSVPTFSAEDAINSGLVDESGSLDLNRGAVTPEPAAVVSSAVEDEIVPNEQKSIVDKALDALQNPIPTMFPAYKFITAATDISDGFYGDLNKILNNKVGAMINKKDFLISKNLRNIISTNKLKISIEDVLSWGDDYQLVFTANKKFRNQINNLGKINNVKLMNIGRIIKDKGIYDDSMNIIKNPSSYDHFS